MAISIHTNLMAGNAARTLGSHYNRLSKSVQRLSSGLRINSAADDAAGLAIRELMRADVSTLNQGIRNANDAISMIQTADGALAVIDEKLIRMKELAEQAATGTYNSTQRLIIHSEYVAMANEIDRIAMATDFNGIHLLDGSLSGVHNGGGLNSTGSMKIHFGSANDSAEDYYYITIGNCTTAALGLQTGGNAGSATWERVEVVTTVQQDYKPKLSYVQYVDPDTGTIYYTDGNDYFTNVSNPGATALDWETDKHIIEKLQTVQKTEKSVVVYSVFTDPRTSLEYFTKDGAQTFTSDPYDPQGKMLDKSNPAHKDILDNLQRANKTLSVNTVWKVYENSSGSKYYSCDGGLTYNSSMQNPMYGILDSKNPDHAAAIGDLQAVQTELQVSGPRIHMMYTEYYDPATDQPYYQYYDNGKYFYASDLHHPFETTLDEAKDRHIVDRLLLRPSRTPVSTIYDTYRDKNLNIQIYTADGGKTFISDLDDPLSFVNPTDIEPVYQEYVGEFNVGVYEDTANPGRFYYSMDNGQRFFADLSNVAGSVLDKNDPGYSSLVANFKKVDSSVTIRPRCLSYRDTVASKEYFSFDGGKTFYTSLYDGNSLALDASNPDHLDVINRLVICQRKDSKTLWYDIYHDSKNPYIDEYYTLTNGPHTTFVRDPKNPNATQLDPGNPADKEILDRLEPEKRQPQTSVETTFPAEILVYEDSRTRFKYYSYDGGQTFTRNPQNPYSTGDKLYASNPAHKDILDNLQPFMTQKVTVTYVKKGGEGGFGATISTQQAAQEALVAIDRAIVSKDTIRAHLGALQNRLENTVTNLSIQAENLQASESRISDTDVATEMTAFVRNQILTESATAMLSQANSYPHMLMTLLNG